MNELVTPAEATGLILSNLPITGIEQVALVDALGRILRTAIVADRAQPPFRRATMDGIAFRGRAIRFRIAGLHAAGDPPPRPLEDDEAWEIMTGAIVPDDCDTLVPYEEIRIADGIANLQSAAETGRFIHEAGSDASQGSQLIPEGICMGPAEIAIAASMGLSELSVSRMPVITILTTGDEAVPVTANPLPWQIRQSNGPVLVSVLRRLGYQNLRGVHVPDDVHRLEQAVDSALASSDLIILCGGISKGKRDHVREVMDARLGPPAFHGVLQRPGKPLAFWSGAPPVFALPGNPVSVLATFTRYVRPALSAMQGTIPSERLTAPLAGPMESLPKLTWLLPARIVNGCVHPLPPQNSGDFISIAGATHLLEIAPGRSTFPAGECVPLHPL
ncbi:MAG: molybdopterin molybdotransferase MoeA [Luteolibacter sp.]